MSRRVHPRHQPRRGREQSLSRLEVVSDGSVMDDGRTCAAAVGSCGCRRARLEVRSELSSVVAEAWGALLAVRLVLDHDVPIATWHTDQDGIRLHAGVLLAGELFMPPRTRYPDERRRPLLFLPPAERELLSALLRLACGRLELGQGGRRAVASAHRACDRLMGGHETPTSMARRCPLSQT
jgi:hypothetical protein